MKVVGIDFGSKRVGVAVSDADGLMAFPKGVFPNDRMLMTNVKDLIASQKAGAVVIGESKARDGSDNPIMGSARQFAEELGWETNLPVHFEPEFYSSAEARLLKEQSSGKVEALVDAEAAAVILNSYLARSRRGEDAYNEEDSHDH